MGRVASRTPYRRSCSSVGLQNTVHSIRSDKYWLMISWVRRNVNTPVRRKSSAARSSPMHRSSWNTQLWSMPLQLKDTDSQSGGHCLKRFFFNLLISDDDHYWYVIANVNVLYFYICITFAIKYLIFKMNRHFHTEHYVVVMPKFTYLKWLICSFSVISSYFICIYLKKWYI